MKYYEPNRQRDSLYGFRNPLCLINVFLLRHFTHALTDTGTLVTVT